MTKPCSPFSSAVKRLFDVFFSCLGLIILSPFFLTVCFLVWLGDRHSPLYMPYRVGRNGAPFRMVKIRSMVMDADNSGVDSTAKDDERITRFGKVIRKVKLDEFSQLWNVLKGDISLVGPRPQVQRDVDIYTNVERELLSVRPGITDFSSIVFADEGDILEGSPDPDLHYNQVIRPWKSRLGLHYIDNRSLLLDLRLILATILNSFSRQAALNWVARMLRETKAEPKLIEIARREQMLEAAPPPGSDEIVTSRE